jgi:hypothetical protein
MTTTRREFLGGFCATAAFTLSPSAFARAVRLRHDPSLTVLLSDIHVNGAKTGRKYQAAELSRTVAEILRLDPLPARVITFGDLARSKGTVADYTLARKLLKPLEDAGIEIRHGLGNHDVRAPFFTVFPEYRKLTPVAGDVVFTVDAGAVEFIMLDVISANAKKTGSCLSSAQQDWFLEALKTRTKPFFVCSHYSIGSLTAAGRPLADHLLRAPLAAGYIYGHHHHWKHQTLTAPAGTAPKTLRTLCLPSTGHWGDIGWALLRTQADRASVSLYQRTHWLMNNPIEVSPADREKSRRRTAKNAGATCTFVLPTGAPAART